MPTSELKESSVAPEIFVHEIAANNYVKQMSAFPAILVSIAEFPPTLQFFGWVCWYENGFREMPACQELRMEQSGNTEREQ